MEEKTQKDTRLTPRAELKVNVNVERQSRLQEYYSKNISEGGIFLIVSGKEPPLKGEVLTLTFKIPNLAKELQIEGQVIYIQNIETLNEKTGRTVKKQGIGIKFINLTSKDKKILSQYISGKDVSVA